MELTEIGMRGILINLTAIMWFIVGMLLLWNGALYALASGAKAGLLEQQDREHSDQVPLESTAKPSAAVSDAIALKKFDETMTNAKKILGVTVKYVLPFNLVITVITMVVLRFWA